MNAGEHAQATDDLARRAPGLGASLSELQEWMALLIRHRRGLPQSQAMQAAAAMHFSGNDRLSPVEQIDIYRRQFWLRHTGLLLEDFPGVSGLLGQNAWEQVAETYLSERGYDIFAVHDLGQKLPQHLAEMHELPHREILVDMARLEWAYANAFAQKDDDILSPEKLTSIPGDAWPSARIILSRALRLLEVRYPVARLRRELRDDPTSVPSRASIPPEPQNLVIYRRERTLWDKEVSTAAFLLLAEFAKGTPLIPACEAVVEKDPTAATVFDEQLSDWFSLWGKLGWITDVRID